MRNYWCRLSTDFWCSPKVLRLLKVCARDAARVDTISREVRWRRALAVYQTLLGVHSEIDGDGTIQDQHLDDAFLVRRSGLEQTVEVDVALNDLEVGGFVSRKGQTLRLIGWNDEWRNARSSTARSQAHRARKRQDESGS